MISTLALDLGTNCGFSLQTDQFSQTGTWILATPKEMLQARKEGWERRLDPRFRQLLDLITNIVSRYEVRRIIFEDVIFMSSQAQAQLWASLRAAIWSASIICWNRQTGKEIDVQAIPVGTLKKFATGNGGADKNEMAEALAKLDRTLSMKVENVKGKFVNVLTKSDGHVMDDNEVDAIWLSRYAKAADDGIVNFTSIWGRKDAAKKEAKERKKRQKQLKFKNS